MYPAVFTLEINNSMEGAVGASENTSDLSPKAGLRCSVRIKKSLVIAGVICLILLLCICEEIRTYALLALSWIQSWLVTIQTAACLIIFVFGIYLYQKSKCMKLKKTSPDVGGKTDSIETTML